MVLWWTKKPTLWFYQSKMWCYFFLITLYCLHRDEVRHHTHWAHWLSAYMLNAAPPRCFDVASLASLLIQRSDAAMATGSEPTPWSSRCPTEAIQSKGFTQGMENVFMFHQKPLHTQMCFVLSWYHGAANVKCVSINKKAHSVIVFFPARINFKLCEAKFNCTNIYI